MYNTIINTQRYQTTTDSKQPLTETKIVVLLRGRAVLSLQKGTVFDPLKIIPLTDLRSKRYLNSALAARWP